LHENAALSSGWPYPLTLTSKKVGQIIGTGIFSNPALILQNCGSGGMMLVLWVIGAIFAGTGVWSYLELGTMVNLDFFFWM
jgi:amino acid transporter